jgi:hypothetical protein
MPQYYRDPLTDIAKKLMPKIPASWTKKDYSMEQKFGKWLGLPPSWTTPTQPLYKDIGDWGNKIISALKKRIKK